MALTLAPRGPRGVTACSPGVSRGNLYWETASPGGVTANEAWEDVGIRCHPFRGLRFQYYDNRRLHRRLYAVAAIAAENF